jgi:nitrogenase-stabilizing/protective protein
MPTLDQLEAVDRAEDYFGLLGVPYDPAVLRASRIHLLRAFGVAIAEIDAREPLPPEGERLRLYRRALRRAYALVARSAAHGRRALRRRCGGCDAAPAAAASCAGAAS